MKIKCAKKVWEEFNKKEKKLWNEFYNLFLEEENFAIGFEDKKRQEITAHNMACRVVWFFER